MEIPEHKFFLSTQIIAFTDCVWSTYEVFSTSLTFFASAHFNGFFQSDEKIIQVDFPAPSDGVQKTFVWTVLILTLIVSVVWVDSSLQLLIGTRQVEKTQVEMSQCRYWLHLSFVLLFLFAFKTYSSTGYVMAFIFSCCAVLYRGLAILIVHDEIQQCEKLMKHDDEHYPPSGLGHGLLHDTLPQIRVHFQTDDHHHHQRDYV